MAPPGLLEAIGPVPVVAPERMVLVGARDQEELDLISPLPEGLGIGRIVDREALRDADLAEVGRSIADSLTAGGGRFWLHLDVDVLDEAAFPATDYLMDDGLSMDRTADPDRPDRRIARADRAERDLLQPGKGPGWQPAVRRSPTCSRRPQ